MVLSIGSDVEFFVVERGTGTVLSAEGFVPGTKDAPHRFDRTNPFFATQLDNVLAEGNIPPAKTSQEFADHLLRLRGHLDGILPAHMRTAAIGAAHLDAGLLQTENARSYGCNVSYCAYDGAPDVPMLPEGSTLRAAGFHVHIGYERPTVVMNERIARFCDVFLGVPSVVLDPQGAVRREAGYGRAGNYRNQKHGCEYRTLSSALAASRRVCEWVFDGAVRALNAAMANEPLPEGNVRQIIDESRRTEARAFIAQHRIVLP